MLDLFRLLAILFITCFCFFRYRMKIFNSIRKLFNNENKIIKGISIFCFFIGFILSIRYNVWNILENIIYWAKYGYLKDFFGIIFYVISSIIIGILTGFIAMLLPLIIKKVIKYLIKKLNHRLNIKFLILFISIFLCLVVALFTSKWLFFQENIGLKTALNLSNYNISSYREKETAINNYDTFLFNEKFSEIFVVLLLILTILNIKKILEILKKASKKVFDNTDKILKGISVFGFLICVVVGIYILLIYVLTGCADFEILFVSIIVLLSSLTSLPLYAFADILTQLKQVNKKSNE